MIAIAKPAGRKPLLFLCENVKPAISFGVFFLEPHQIIVPVIIKICYHPAKFIIIYYIYSIPRRRRNGNNI